MRKILLAALVLSTGCATTSIGSSSHAAFDAWNGVSSTKVSCQASPALCAKLEQAATRYTRTGPFMPE